METTVPRSSFIMLWYLLEGPSRKLVPPAVMEPVVPVTTVFVAVVLVVEEEDSEGEAEEEEEEEAAELTFIVARYSAVSSLVRGRKLDSGIYPQ